MSALNSGPSVHSAVYGGGAHATGMPPLRHTIATALPNIIYNIIYTPYLLDCFFNC